MKQRFTLTIISLLLSTTFFGQEVKIGQSANEIMSMVKMGAGYRSNSTWDVSYENGQIEDVILCQYNEYMIDIGTYVNYCKHFLMKNGSLTRILTQYENLSVSQLKNYYNQLHNKIKIEDKYYDGDYLNYSIIYLHSNGLATIEWTKTDLQSLPINIRSQVENKIKEEKEQEYQKQLKDRKLRELENEIKSKIFDFEKEFPQEYEVFISNQHNKFLQFFRKHVQGDYSRGRFFPNYYEIKDSKQKFARSINIYNIEYKTGKPYVIDLIFGDDNNLSIGLGVMSLPILYKEGIRTNTKLNLDRVKIDYTIGFTSVKIKNGVVEFKKTPPVEEHKALLLDKLREFPNGKHLILYEVSDILNELNVNVKIAEIMGRFIELGFDD